MFDFLFLLHQSLSQFMQLCCNYSVSKRKRWYFRHKILVQIQRFSEILTLTKLHRAINIQMSKKALITSITVQYSAYLTELLLSRGWVSRGLPHYSIQIELTFSIKIQLRTLKNSFSTMVAYRSLPI